MDYEHMEVMRLAVFQNALGREQLNNPQAILVGQVVESPHLTAGVAGQWSCGLEGREAKLGLGWQSFKSCGGRRSSASNKKGLIAHTCQRISAGGKAVTQ